MRTQETADADEATYEMIRDLIQSALDEDARTTAVDWLDRHHLTYRAIDELGLLPSV